MGEDVAAAQFAGEGFEKGRLTDEGKALRVVGAWAGLAGRTMTFTCGPASRAPPRSGRVHEGRRVAATGHHGQGRAGLAPDHLGGGFGQQQSDVAPRRIRTGQVILSHSGHRSTSTIGPAWNARAIAGS